MDLLIDFVLAIREFITMQYDLKDASAIDLNGKQVGNIIWGNRNTAVKAQYDNADNCYLKIETLLKTSEASDGSFSLMTLLDKVELPKLTKVRKQVEQFSDAHDIDYLVRTFNDKLFHPNKNIAIEEIKLSLSGNLHFILNSDIEDNNEKAFAQNYLWLTNKIHCVDERAQEYSLLYSNVPEFLRLLSVDYKRFITLINDRLYKLLNKGGCIFINDNQKVYVYGNDFKKGIELTDTQLTDKLLAQKRGYAYTFWGIEEIYPENIYWLIKNVCADKTQSDDVGSYVKR